MSMRNFRRTILFCLVYTSTVKSANTQAPGTLLWNASTGWITHAIAVAGDVNDDGIPDVFAGSGNDSVFCFSGSDGELLWSYGTAGDVWSVARLNDVDGDGAGDCLAGGANNVIYCVSGRPVANATHSIWTFPVGGDVWTVSSVRDLNGDGINDCLAGAADNRVYCLSGSDGKSLWSHAASSDILSVDAIPDVNGDGKDDCVAGGKDDSIVCISGGSSKTGNVLWTYQTGSTVLSVKSIGDVNGDGRADCLAGSMDDRVYCISGNSSGNATLLWSYATGATVQSVFPIMDANGDGKQDCLAGGQDNKVVCLSGTNGSVIWSLSTASTVRSVAAIADVNGTGGEDCIAGGEDNRVYCIEGKSTGSGSLLWSYAVGGTVKQVSAVSDISQNGVADVLAASDDSYVYAVEGGAPVAPPEAIGTPAIPSGPSAGVIGQSLNFTAGGSTSNLGHLIEYRFDWGDGNISEWGAASRNVVYTQTGTHAVRAQARCQTHNAVVSGWSPEKWVTLSGYTLTVMVNGSGSVVKVPDKVGYNQNETVSLTANPAAGWQFDRWSGDLSGSANPASLAMAGNKTVTAVFVQIQETVSSPNAPAGPSSGKVAQSLTFTSGGSVSNLWHSIEYRFDWGDGSTSAWGGPSAATSYTNVGQYFVKVQARCQIHTAALSGWSMPTAVTISGRSIAVWIVGSGSVSRNPEKSAYNHNESVTLTAIPVAGYRFDRWEGALTGNANPGTVVMTDDKTVTAYFVQSSETVTSPNAPSGPSSGKVGQTLTLTTGGSGSNLGHAVDYRFDWGDGTQSGWGLASQNHAYVSVGSYAVMAQARCQSDPGVVSGWSAGFGVSIAGHTLTFSMNGSGIVTRNPDKTQYNHNEAVTLTASPAAGYSFSRWGGDLEGSANPAVLTMTGDKTVMAFFDPVQETVSPPGTPGGSSSGEPGESLAYFTSESVSSLGHALEYQFDWGNGELSGWGFWFQNHQWFFPGSYWITVRARCVLHPTILSDWSDGFFVAISTTGVEKIDANLAPSEFRLSQNYPNPFNGETWITYAIPRTCDVRVEVYDVHGARIATCASNVHTAGVYRVKWNGRYDNGQSAPSGLYLARLTAGEFQAVKMMVYLK